ncbi:MAG: hypothetical protein LBF75_02045 [Treponema sp.]|jgi:hypothetical protein|nr:hypothetical protein [Treponema sp.]
MAKAVESADRPSISFAMSLSPRFPDFSCVKYHFDWLLFWGLFRLTFRNQTAVDRSFALQDSWL